MTSTHHMADNDLDNATPQQLSQIGVNTIAINNNANSIVSANTNIATNTTNITAANSAIVSNDSDITAINNTINSIFTTNTNQTNSINSILGSITTLNTTTTNNTTAIATNLATNNTQTTNIATNASGIATNLTTNNTQTTNIATNASGIATNLATNNTQTTNIASNTTNIATNTTGIATNLATNNTQNTNISTNASNIASNTSAISSNTTELSHITITADTIAQGKGKIGKLSNANSYGLQNTDFNATMTLVNCGVRQSNTGNTFLNAATGKNVNMSINNVKHIEVVDGIIKMGKQDGSNIQAKVVADNDSTATFYVGGSNTQGTARIGWGQAHSNSVPTTGGGIIFNGDDTPNIDAPQNYSMMVNYSGGTETNVLGYKHNDDYLRHYRSLYNSNYKENFYGSYAEPKLIGMTAVSAATLQSHRFCYNGATATDNTWYMPHPDFKCVSRTPVGITKGEFVISFTTDGYFSTRNVYVCLSTSSSPNNIIPSTITFIHSRNSEWTSRIHRVSVFDTTLTANALNVRYILVKEVQVGSTGSVISSGGNQGFIVFGGRDAHAGTTATQTTHYFDNDLTPATPTDQCQALLVKCWSIPSTAGTSASTTNPFQLIGF